VRGNGPWQERGPWACARGVAAHGRVADIPVADSTGLFREARTRGPNGRGDSERGARTPASWARLLPGVRPGGRSQAKPAPPASSLVDPCAGTRQRRRSTPHLTDASTHTCRYLRYVHSVPRAPHASGSPRTDLPAPLPRRLLPRLRQARPVLQVPPDPRVPPGLPDRPRLTLRLSPQVPPREPFASPAPPVPADRTTRAAPAGPSARRVRPSRSG
jgi:hypothetical protein